jgi:hypothetical protein
MKVRKVLNKIFSRESTKIKLVSSENAFNEIIRRSDSDVTANELTHQQWKQKHRELCSWKDKASTTSWGSPRRTELGTSPLSRQLYCLTVMKSSCHYQQDVKENKWREKTYLAMIRHLNE